MHTPAPQDPLAGYRLMEKPRWTWRTLLVIAAVVLTAGFGATAFVHCGTVKRKGHAQDSYCSEARWRSLFARFAPVSPPGGACGGWLPNRCLDGYACKVSGKAGHSTCVPKSP